jgi:hypothetical protein
LAVTRHVKELFTRLGVKNDGPDRYAQCDVISRGAILVRAASVLSVAAYMFASIAEVNQGVDVAISSG